MQSPRTPSSPRPTRSVLLKIPNAKASKLSDRETWTFLALGEFVVYQVQQSGSTSGSRTPPPVPGRSGGTGVPPQLPARAGGPASPAPIPVPQPVGWMNGQSSSTQSPSSPSASTPAGAAGIVLAVRSTEFPISTTTTTTFEAPNTYILNNGDSYVVKIELDLPRTGSHEILDNVLRKYAHLGGSLGVPSAGGSASSSGASTPELRPSDFKGSLLLIDETTGKILGPLNQDMPMNENNNIHSTEAPNQMSSNDPVVVSFGDEDPNSANAGQVQVSAFDDVTSQYGKSDSRIVGAAEYVSKGLLFAAEYGANYTSKAATDYKARTKATDTPLVFSPTTKKGVAMVAGGTEQAAKFTRGAVNFIGGKVEALAVGAVNTSADGLKAVGIGGGSGGKPVDRNSGWRGALRSGIQAVTTVADGLEKGGKHFLETGRQSTNTVVQHRYGDEARDITDSITSAGSNVVLVYVDARGVMHRALLKRAGKGALKARMKDGREVVLDDSGMDGQHTTRDEQGNLVVVDEKNGEAYDVVPAGGANYDQAGYSTGVESNYGSDSSALRRAPPAVPPRF